MDALKCFDEEMNPVHDDVSLEDVENGIHKNCGNLVMVWQDADPSFAEKAHQEGGVTYRFTVSESSDGERVYAQAHVHIP